MTNRVERLHEINRALSDFEQELREMVNDDQTDAERLHDENGWPFDDFTEDDNGNQVGIIYPENASPDLDAAVSCLWEAQMCIAEACHE